MTNVYKKACDIKDDKSDVFPHCQIQDSSGLFTFWNNFFSLISRQIRIQCPADKENDENDTSHSSKGASPAKCINENLAHWAQYK